MMYHSITIEESSKHNNFTFDRIWCAWLPLRWLGFGFNVIDIHPWFVISYYRFEQSWLIHIWTPLVCWKNQIVEALSLIGGTNWRSALAEAPGRICCTYIRNLPGLPPSFKGYILRNKNSITKIIRPIDKELITIQNQLFLKRSTSNKPYKYLGW